MQKVLDQLNENDRPIVRKCRLAAFAFYGSILAGMVLYVVLHWNPEVHYASVDSAARAKIVGTSGASGPAPFAP
jgi:hypothetical protein